MEQSRVDAAVSVMLGEFEGNLWMLNEHWPLIQSHAKRMMADVIRLHPLNQACRVLDVGCFNGYLSLLFRQLGFSVTGADMYETEEQKLLFKKHGISFLKTNLNNLDPFQSCEANSFDIVIVGQVLEHILNHPLGLMRDLVRIMNSGGTMILTTPNPSTIQGAFRLLRGQALLWGGQDFINLPKIEHYEVISKADIHYHEYTQSELECLLTQVGLTIEDMRYIGLGATSDQSLLKRFFKKSPLWKIVEVNRLFASNHYALARKN